MALTEIITLIDLARQMVSRKAELDQEYYVNFILPTWEKFIEVHNDYKESFRRYSDSIADESTSIPQLIETIRRDSIYTSDLREELSNLVMHLPPARPGTKEAHLQAFVVAICNYLAKPLADSRTDPGPMKVYQGSDIKIPENIEPFLHERLQNALRAELSVYLSRKGQGTNRPRATWLSSKLVFDLQLRYDEVSKAHNLLKKDLLT